MEKTLSEKAYDHIRKRLVGGELAPGSRLVNRTLASEIGVSVIPVREAIHRLATEGLVEHVPGSGAFVRRADREQLDQLYVLREALESCAAGEAARHITEYQLEELTSILEEEQQIARQLGESPRSHATRRQMNAWLDTEQRFHERLIDAARNPLLAKVTQEYRAIGEIFDAQRHDPRLLTADVARVTCTGKAALIAALRARDRRLATQLASEQIRRGRKRVLDHLRRTATG